MQRSYGRIFVLRDRSRPEKLKPSMQGRVAKKKNEVAEVLVLKSQIMQNVVALMGSKK